MRHLTLILLIALMSFMTGCKTSHYYNTVCLDGVVYWKLKNTDKEEFYVPYYTPDGSIAICPKSFFKGK